MLPIPQLSENLDALIKGVAEGTLTIEARPAGSRKADDTNRNEADRLDRWLAKLGETDTVK